MGAGVYFLNLRDIRRKQETGAMSDWPEFVMWQRKRMTELGVLSVLTLGSAILVTKYHALALPVAVFSFPIASWQLALNRDYSKLGFISRGTERAFITERHVKVGSVDIG